MVRGDLRRVDDLGRIVIPAWARKELGMGPGTQVEMVVRGCTVMIEVAPGRCKLCGKKVSAEQSQICSGCRHRIQLGLE